MTTRVHGEHMFRREQRYIDAERASHFGVWAPRRMVYEIMGSIDTTVNEEWGWHPFAYGQKEDMVGVSYISGDPSILRNESLLLDHGSIVIKGEHPNPILRIVIRQSSEQQRLIELTEEVLRGHGIEYNRNPEEGVSLANERGLEFTVGTRVYSLKAGPKSRNGTGTRTDRVLEPV